MERPTVAELVDALKDPAQEEMMYDQMQGIRNRTHTSSIAQERMPRERLIAYGVQALGGCRGCCGGGRPTSAAATTRNCSSSTWTWTASS